MKPLPRHTLLRYAVSITLALLGSLLTLLGLYVLPGTVEYQVTERYTFFNPGAPSTYALGVLLPKSGPYQQVTVNANPAQVLSTAETQSLRFEGSLPAGEMIVEVAFTARLFQGDVRWDGPTTPADLAEQPGIEVSAPVIQALAARMTGAGEAAIFERFSYAAGALKWPTGARINVASSAVNALDEGIGGCTEFSFLFTALNRAAGVPTRSISGLALPLMQPPFIETSATWSHPAGAHAWVEFYDGQQWTFGDPAWASQLPARQYFGRTDGSHLSYGEFSAEAAAQAEILQWVKARGSIVGSMSAPLKFSAGSPGQGVTFTPSVTLKKTRDDRWLYGLLGFVLMLVMVKVGDWWVMRKKIK